LGVTVPGAVNQAYGDYEILIVYQDELILKPGEGLALYQEQAAGDNNVVFRFAIEWSEASIAVTIECTTSLTETIFPTLDNNAVYTSSPNATTTVTTNNSTGFTMKIYDAGDGTNPGLYKSTSPTSTIGSANDSFVDEATLQAGVSGFGIQATTTSSQITISPRFNKTGNDVGGLEAGSANAVVVASSSVAVSNQVITFIHKAAVSPTKPPGNYSDTIFIVCSANP
jgi:hypothetical protein